MRNLFLILFTLFAFNTSFAQQYLEKQDTPIINTIPNAGFEAGKGQWVISVSSTATIVSGSSALQGASSLRFDSTASSQTVATKSITVPKMLQGKLCQIEVSYYNNEPTNFYLLRAKDASGTVLASTQLSTVTSQAVARVNNFNCPTTTMSAEVISVASAAAVDLDSFHLGSVKNITKSEVVSVLGYEPVATVSATSPLTITGGASNPVISLDDSGAASGSTYTKVRVDGKGRVTSGSTLTENDIPSLQTTKITTGVFAVNRGGTGLSSVTTGDLLVGSGTALVNLGVGASGTVLTVDSSGVPAWQTVTASATVTSTYLNIASTTTITTATNVVFATAANGPYTVTVPTASSTGITLTLQKTDTASHVISLATQFGQTFTYPGGTTSATSRLNTVGETVSLLSSGTTWVILSRDYSSATIGSATTTFSNSGSAKGAGDYDNVYVERLNGSLAFIKFKFRQGVAGTTGTGDYLFTLPFGLRFDPSKTYFSTSTNVYDTILQGATAGGIGTIANGTNSGPCYPVAYDATRFRMACSVNYSNYGWFGQSLYGLGGGSMGFSMNMTVDVENWLE